MRFFILPIFLIFLIFTSGCGNNETVTTSPVNTNSSSANISKTNADNPLNTTKAPEAATTNNAPTLAPVVQSYYEALRKKDDAALRKVYSQATLKTLEADMKEENKKSLSEFITELEPVPDKPFEVRNEEIQGDAAIAEIRGGSYPNGIKIKFVRESGEWKMTNESPEVQSVKQSATNTAK